MVVIVFLKIMNCFIVMIDNKVYGFIRDYNYKCIFIFFWDGGSVVIGMGSIMVIFVFVKMVIIVVSRGFVVYVVVCNDVIDYGFGFFVLGVGVSDFVYVIWFGFVFGVDELDVVMVFIFDMLKVFVLVVNNEFY